MAVYSQFLGCRVTVQYRAGDILLTATGSFVGDSGRSIFLEQHIEQRGKRNYFRWEIPYPYIHHLEAEAHTATTSLDTSETSATAPLSKVAVAGNSSID